MTLTSIWIVSFALLLLIQIKNDLVIIEVNGIGLDIDSEVIVNFWQYNGDGRLFWRNLDKFWNSFILAQELQNHPLWNLKGSD